MNTRKLVRLAEAASVVVCVLAAAACGKEEVVERPPDGDGAALHTEPPGGISKPSAGPSAKDFSDRKVSGYHTSPRGVFEIHRAACADFPRASLARQMGAPEDATPAQIARTYRERLQIEAPPEIQQAIEAGCLAGILDRAGR